MDRKTFIKRLGAAGLTAGMVTTTPLLSYAGRGTRRITILHTNDTHSRIEPFPDTDSRYPGLAGVSRRATLINEIRSAEENVLLLDAGDAFQGTPYFNYYNGELDFRVMSKLGYDAMTIGNHEFDNGVQGFVDVADHANFPFVSSNYEFGDTPMADYVKSNLVKTVDGIRVGIFGLGVDFSGLVLPELHQGVRYLNPYRIAQYQTNRLLYFHKCDVIICLSHLGYHYDDPNRVDDRKIAQRTSGLDLIIGGHTHTFLDAPERIRKDDGTVTLISQVGFAGIVLGRIDLVFNRSREIVQATSAYQTVHA